MQRQMHDPENGCNQDDAHQGSKRPLLKTMLEAVSMRLPPHSTVAHMGRGVTPHCSWHLSMDSFRLKGCRACHGSAVCQPFLAPLSCELTDPCGFILQFCCSQPALGNNMESQQSQSSEAAVGKQRITALHLDVT